LAAAQEEQQKAQDAVERQKALIDAQAKNNDLLREQADILERIAKAMEKAGAAGGGGVKATSPKKPETKRTLTMEEVMRMYTNIPKGPFDSLLDKLEDAKGKIDNFFSSIGGAASGAGSKITSFVTQLKADFGPSITLGIQLVTDSWNDLKKAFVESWPDIQKTFADMGADTQKLFGDEDPKTSIKFLIVGAFALISSTIKRAAEFWRENHDWILATTRFVFGSIMFFLRVVMLAIEWIFKAAFFIFTTDWGKVLKKIWEMVVKKITDVVNEFSGLLTRISLIFTDPATLDGLKAAGTGIVNAVKDGVMDAAKGLADAAARVVTDAIEAAKNAAGSVVGGLIPGTTNKGGGSTSTGKAKGRAEGGFVGAGELVLVGEKGPELLMPKVDSFIVPNKAIHQAASYFTTNNSSSTTSKNSNINVSLAGAQFGNQMQAETFKTTLVSVLRRELT
jgi:hypothetical protein